MDLHKKCYIILWQQSRDCDMMYSFSFHSCHCLYQLSSSTPSNNSQPQTRVSTSNYKLLPYMEVIVTIMYHSMEYYHIWKLLPYLVYIGVLWIFKTS